MLKMIDYENVLKDFLGEIIVYLTRSLKKAKDKVVYERVIKGIENLKVIKTNPLYYANYDIRLYHNLLVEPDAFIIPDNTFHEYSKVIYAAQSLNDTFDYNREKAQNVLMDGYKLMKLKNAKNAFEKLKFNLLSPEKIVMKSNQK